MGFFNDDDDVEPPMPPGFENGVATSSRSPVVEKGVEELEKMLVFNSMITEGCFRKCISQKDKKWMNTANISKASEVCIDDCVHKYFAALQYISVAMVPLQEENHDNNTNTTAV